jgi:hypothetical protein
VTTIRNQAFNGCSGIQSLNLNKVTTIGNSAFNGCSGINQISSSLNTEPNFSSSAFSYVRNIGNFIYAGTYFEGIPIKALDYFKTVGLPNG